MQWMLECCQCFRYYPYSLEFYVDKSLLDGLSSLALNTRISSKHTCHAHACVNSTFESTTACSSVAYGNALWLRALPQLPTPV